MQSAVSSSGIRNLWGDRRSLLLILCLTLYLMLAFLSWSLWTCCLSESLWILAPSPSLPFCALVSIRSGEYFPLNSFSVMVSVGGCMQGWFPLAGLPPCYAWGVQAPVQPLRHQFPSSSIGNEFNEPLPNQSTWSVTVVINSYSLSFENKEGGEGGLHNILGEIVREGGLMEDLRY